jgi:succinoglycan biosynthesis protein ExoA
MSASDRTSLEHLPPLGADCPVSVVIPARGAAALLGDCLAALLPQLRADDEVVVAAGDTPTAERARELARSEPRLRVVENRAGTTPAALNAACAAARHPVLLRVDAQARLPAGYRDRVVELLRSTGAANVGGRQVAVGDRGTAGIVALAMNSRLGHGGAAYRSGRAQGPVDTVYLGTFRREALDAVGGFDEAFTTNQDAELNERLRRAGGTVWLDPALEVGYLPRRSFLALARQFRGYGRGRAMTARRHPGSLRPRQLAAPSLLVGLLVALLLVPWTPVPLAVWAAGYGALLLLGGALEIRTARTRLPGVLVALVVMHLAWGYGFLTAPRRVGGPWTASGAS